MSQGPTGVRGLQGPVGVEGPSGRTGMTGLFGPQGEKGPTGVKGPTGIPGSTGIQLYGNGSLVQCSSVRVSTAIPDEYTPVNLTFQTFNPALAEPLFNTSVAISGQYDASGLNYYGNPLSFSTEFITVPAGKYYMSAIVTLNNALSGLTPPPFTIVTSLESYNQVSFSTLTKGTAAGPGGASHLQYYYTPTEDTDVVVRVAASSGTEPFGLFLNPTPMYPSATLSIVKIW